MTDKEILINIIINKGSCTDISMFMNCTVCPVSEACSYVVESGSQFVEDESDIIYEAAINKYLKTYSTCSLIEEIL